MCGFHGHRGAMIRAPSARRERWPSRIYISRLAGCSEAPRARGRRVADSKGNPSGRPKLKLELQGSYRRCIRSGSRTSRPKIRRTRTSWTSSFPARETTRFTKSTQTHSMNVSRRERAIASDCVVHRHRVFLMARLASPRHFSPALSFSDPSPVTRSTLRSDSRTTCLGLVPSPPPPPCSRVRPSPATRQISRPRPAAHSPKT